MGEGKQVKKLVIYYSLEGNTRFIAENIANTIGADWLELKPEQEINPQGFMKYILGGKQVMTKEKPMLKPWNKQPGDYDFLVMGTPVWAFSYASPFNTFFSTVTLQNKKVALFCCHGGGKGKTLENMEKALAGNCILGKIDFQDPAKKDREKNAKKAKDWAQEMLKLVLN